MLRQPLAIVAPAFLALLASCGSTSVAGDTDASSGTDPSSDASTTMLPATGGEPTGSSTADGDGTSDTSGSSEGAPTGSSGTDPSTGSTAGTTDDTGGSVVACGVEDPLLCEDFEAADALDAWQLTVLAGNSVTVEDSDSPARPRVVAATTEASAVSKVAGLRRLVDAPGGLLTIEFGGWIRFDAGCLGAWDLTPLALNLHDPDGGALAMQAAVWFQDDGGYLFLVSDIQGVPSSMFTWDVPTSVNAWHRVDVRVDLATGDVRLVVDDDVLVEDMAPLNLVDPLDVTILAGIQGFGLEGGCTIRQDDLYVRAG